MNNTKICFITSYSGKQIWKHGGVHRSDQIKNSINKYYRKITNFIDIRSDTKLKQILYIVFMPLIFLKLSKYKLTLTGLIKACSIYKNLRKYIKNKNNYIFIVEGWDDIYLICSLVLLTFNKKYFLFPQNIDFLFPYYKSTYFKSIGFRYVVEKELYINSKCNFVISEFDMNIISCFNNNTEIYNYFPDEEHEKELIKIRLKRINSLSKSSSEILIIGTIHSTTRAAFESFLKNLENIKILDYKIKIAGYGTEISNKYKSDKIEVYGSVNNKILENLLISTKFILIPAVQTTGFLTKLIDMNLSGIPIIIFGKYIQVKNLQEYGIYYVENIEKLNETINKIEYVPKKYFENLSIKNFIDKFL